MPDPLPARPEPRLSQVSDLLFITLAGLMLGAMAWGLVGSQRRTQARLWLLRSWQQAMSRTARRAGVRSMARELRWGVEDYRLPYSLSLRRERAARAYDRARDVTA